ncbi:MAG TPA: A/G-specific adenine glycosylase [Candidatus Paceibacterota bacterium]|nr:A/G-specific adenine glycosylase [Candidatus Paceibacterota bacterium]
MKKINMKKIEVFKRTVWSYYGAHKRDFPWRRTRDPYRILVSEFMLQQTQTYRVEPKYLWFLERFPSFRALAKAPLREVLRAWSGLGYNRRAVALKRTAEIVVRDYGGKLPKDIGLLDALPGIGPGTAGAIRAFAFNLPSVFIETNIRRAFIHFFFPKRGKIGDDEILDLIEETLDAKRPREWYWALMDYGAMLGRLEKENPNRKSAHYKKQSKFEGSTRQLRGAVLRAHLANPKLSFEAIARKICESTERVKMVMELFKEEGIV